MQRRLKSVIQGKTCKTEHIDKTQSIDSSISQRDLLVVRSFPQQIYSEMENLPNEIQKMILDRLLPLEVEERKRLFGGEANLSVPDWYSYMVKGSNMLLNCSRVPLMGKVFPCQCTCSQLLYRNMREINNCISDFVQFSLLLKSLLTYCELNFCRKSFRLAQE